MSYTPIPHSPTSKLTSDEADNAFRASGAVLIIRGIVAVIFGILLIAWPRVTVIAMVYVFGIYAIIDGIAGITHYFGERRSRSGWFLVGAVVSIIAGLVALFWPGITAVALAFVVAFWAILLGLAEISMAMRFRRSGRHWGFMLIAGIAAVLLGIFMVAQPAAGFVNLIAIVAVFAWVFGIAMIVVGLQLRRAARVYV